MSPVCGSGEKVHGAAPLAGSWYSVCTDPRRVPLYGEICLPYIKKSWNPCYDCLCQFCLLFLLLTPVLQMDTIFVRSLRFQHLLSHALTGPQHFPE